MCEHEFICPNCNGNGYLELHAMGPEKCNVCRGKGVVQSMPTNLIANLEKALLNDLYQQLAAANARIAELEKELSTEKIHREKLLDEKYDEKGICLSSRLHEANARIAELERQKAELHKCLIFDGEMLGEYQQKLKQAEAQNKRMREALEEIKDVKTNNAWTDYNECFFDAQNIAKAALEGE